ncbi:MAG: murein L,D-transpeptidase [Chitinophagaceae bacterium]|nr:murein L,D-transpeptidase [Chitinophagaceae bacterium]
MKNFGLRTFILLAFSILFFSFSKSKKRKIVKRTSIGIKINSSLTSALVKDNPYYIIIDKSDYELKVYDEEGWYATYPVVFGSNDLNDKYMEGDKKTPEGHFKVLLKKIHPQWGPELLLDFPNQESIKKFNERQSRGLIPRTARIGSGIAIHATRPQEEWTVDYFQNWTDGCVSLKYSEAKDLYSYIPSGTPVTIQK